ncbi:hypothetical protein PC116_g10935 [Phytophthora cactorum]|uniref:Uncharacterized protein n=1 Tax=Phytophthora cactorum TaxID=29920 RepID=A0A8T1L1F9_9STRA|nr:hypothetical protein PC114_g8036 [Phytophthora cactorum]KAG2945990.1 hypothetical protein PC117_g8023 [Phytophthora cactorum]KAG4241145.1 hypothetical protein PC116_g10935 [Phytophthora cactorum]
MIQLGKIFGSAPPILHCGSLSTSTAADTRPRKRQRFACSYTSASARRD